jgi:hypothetical protein
MLSARAGPIPGEVVVTPAAGATVDFDIALDYRGSATISPRGAHIPAGAPYRFSYSHFFAPIEWRVRFFEYTDASDPVRQPDAFRNLVAGKPLKATSSRRLDYVSGRDIEEGLPRDRFALVADGVAELPPGDYTLRVISDDGVRVWMDGKPLIDAWSPHESKVDEAAIPGGRRRFRVEYYDVTGFAELRFDIQKRKPALR